MALFFNLTTLEELACNDPYKFLYLLEFHHNKKLPKNNNAKYKPATKSLAGSSFLLNPDRLFTNNTVDIYYKIQYIKLAARRDYLMYKLYRYTGINLSYYPDIDLEAARQNPLLEVTKDEIKFKYER